MKPRNFPHRRMRRQHRALKRLTVWGVGVLIHKSDEALALHAALPPGYVPIPTDIRQRIGRKNRSS